MFPLIYGYISPRKFSYKPRRYAFLAGLYLFRHSCRNYPATVLAAAVSHICYIIDIPYYVRIVFNNNSRSVSYKPRRYAFLAGLYLLRRSCRNYPAAVLAAAVFHINYISAFLIASELCSIITVAPFHINLAVMLSLQDFTCSGVPAAIILPPSSPPPGPISII